MCVFLIKPFSLPVDIQHRQVSVPILQSYSSRDTSSILEIQVLWSQNHAEILVLLIALLLILLCNCYVCGTWAEYTMQCHVTCYHTKMWGDGTLTPWRMALFTLMDAKLLGFSLEHSGLHPRPMHVFPWLTRLLTSLTGYDRHNIHILWKRENKRNKPENKKTEVGDSSVYVYALWLPHISAKTVSWKLKARQSTAR